MVSYGKESIIAIIPARGGSKRIPRKNVKLFCGKPILTYSIAAAKDSGLFDEIMVSTDDKEISEIAQQYGAAVPFFRSAAAADDYATITDVLLEVLEQYKQLGKVFSYVCCIYPTAPFITSRHLITAAEQLTSSDADGILTVAEFPYPPMRGLVQKGPYMEMKWPEYMFVRSQDLESMYQDCGQFFILRTAAFVQEKKILCDKLLPLILSGREVQDIDTEMDWQIAELKYELLKKRCQL